MEVQLSTYLNAEKSSLDQTFLNVDVPTFPFVIRLNSIVRLSYKPENTSYDIELFVVDSTMKIIGKSDLFVIHTDDSHLEMAVKEAMIQYIAIPYQEDLFEIKLHINNRLVSTNKIKIGKNSNETVF